ncbi:MAG: hypothetical protein JW910_10035 [Anaerolineae bacterium]|nr:hypothetical protein [Anaerolineae bacterium]
MPRYNSNRKTVVSGWAAHPDAPLNELAQGSARLEVPISEAGLHQRINEQVVGFLEPCLRRV